MDLTAEESKAFWPIYSQYEQELFALGDRASTDIGSGSGLSSLAARRLGFDDFFALFGSGRHPGFADLYRSRLRPELSPFAQRYWDRHGDWFAADAAMALLAVQEKFRD